MNIQFQDGVSLQDNKTKNPFFINYPPPYPLSVHLYITNECNLNCKRCHYRSASEIKKELSFHQVKHYFEEWKQYGLVSIAIGGGEPLLHPEINEIVQVARNFGFFVAITTNGTILKDVFPHRIHISYDELHPTWKNESLIQKAINHYNSLGCEVGINHIVSNLENIDYIDQTFTNFNHLLLIRQKPYSEFDDWDLIPRRKHYLVDTCRNEVPCEQGILSFHLNYDSRASICSNFRDKIIYTNLNETWRKLKKFTCNIREFNYMGENNEVRF